MDQDEILLDAEERMEKAVGVLTNALKGIRHPRRDANKHADTAEKEKSLSGDDCKATKEQIQDLTKKYEGLVNDKAASREREVMEN